jgi:hypothetical protein
MQNCGPALILGVAGFLAWGIPARIRSRSYRAVAARVRWNALPCLVQAVED